MGAAPSGRPVVITDEDVPDAIARFLASRGHAVLRVRDHFGTGTPDHVIARGASDQHAIVYTFNERHFLALARRKRKNGQLSRHGKGASRLPQRLSDQHRRLVGRAAAFFQREIDESP